MSLLTVEIEYGIGTLEYDNEYINEITRGSQSMADNILPNYGILPSYGEIKFNDRNGRFKELASNRNLRADLPVIIKCKGNPIGYYLSEKWDYADSRRTIKLELKDRMQDWYKRKLPSRTLTNNETAYTIYLELVALMPTETFVLDADVQDWLESIKIKYAYFNADTYGERWNKLCQIGQLLVYRLPNNDIMVSRHR